MISSEHTKMILGILLSMAGMIFFVCLVERRAFTERFHSERKNWQIKEAILVMVPINFLYSHLF